MNGNGVNGNGNGGLRTVTRLELDAKEVLKQEKIRVGSTMMASKCAPGTSGEQIGKLKTNLHGLVMKEVAYVYRYEVTVFIHTRSGKDYEFTKRVPGDTEVIDRREKCTVIFRVLKEQQPDFFRGGPWAIFYDQQVILYSMRHLYMDENNTKTLIINEGLPDTWRFNRCSVVVRSVAEDKEKILLGRFPEGGDSVQRLDLEQLLSIATSQHIIFNSNQHVIFTPLETQKGKSTEAQIYLRDPQQFGFQPREYPDLASDIRLAIGCSKATRFIEGPGGAGNKTMALNVQTKKSPFYKTVPVLQMATQLLRARDPQQLRVTLPKDIQMLDSHLKGLSVDTSYDHPLFQRFKIHRVFEQNAREKRFPYNDQMVTVEQYFMLKYKIRLEYPLVNLLVRSGNEDRYYPMELCIISDNQKVREMHQQKLGLDRKTMVEKCSMHPEVMLESNRRMVESLSLTDNNYLKSAHLEFYPACLQVNARLLPPPSIEYQGSTVNTGRGNTWACHKFLIPMQCVKWAAYCLKGGGQRTFPGEIDQDGFVHFINNVYLPEARRRGMQFDKPLEIVLKQNATMDHLYEVMAKAKEENLQFVLIAHPDTADEMHHAMKLYERRNEVITQGLKVGTIQRVLQRPQPQTIQNIVQKTNMKLGGLNYRLNISEQWSNEVLGTNTLFIGFGVNHPAGGLGGLEESEPSGSNGDGNGSSHLTNGHSNGDVNGNGYHSNGNGHYTNGSGHYTNGNGYQSNGNGGNGHHVEIAHSIPEAQTNGSPAGSNGEDRQQRKIPSVVGFSANMGKLPFEFVGDFYYQTAQRDEKVNIIRDVVKRCLERWCFNRNGVPPSRVFIYRNGCGEGQFTQILKYEIPLVKNELGPGIPLTVIVSNKKQKIRLFNSQINPNDKGAEKNVQPGTVVDTGAVHPSFTEFFVVSARALQGTSRVPRYSLLYDDNKLTLDQLENITYRLAYGHQIVCLPVSLPAPVYIAEEYAKRGRNLYRQQMNEHPNVHRALGKSYEELTDDLSFRGSEMLSSRRVNA